MCLDAPLMLTNRDLAHIRAAYLSKRSTHWSSCNLSHPACAIEQLIDTIEQLQEVQDKGLPQAVHFARQDAYEVAALTCDTLASYQASAESAAATIRRMAALEATKGVS